MIYKNLIDNENVHRYPNVIGMEKNLFFIDHNNLESAVSIHIAGLEPASQDNRIAVPYSVHSNR